MKFAVLSDIHSNREALDAVLADARAQGADYGYCLGDLVGYGPDPVYCLDQIRSFCKGVVLGNHDSYLLGFEKTDSFSSNSQIAIHLNRMEVEREHLDFIAQLPYVLRQENCFFTHASPRSPADWVYLYRPPEIIESFEFFEEDFAFFGHTHMPIMVTKGPKGFQLSDQKMNFLEEGVRALINPGSVGQPRDEDPRASYCLVCPELRTVEFRRVDYDLKLTQRKLQDRGYPEHLWKRLAVGI